MSNTDAHLTNLPARRTRLIGRQADLAAVRDLVLHGDLRLVTLIGAPGAGKTSLALEVARAVTKEMPDGAWLVSLELADSDTNIALLLGSTLGVAEDPDRAAAERLRLYLQPRQALILLDNCEQVAAECGELADLLLWSCPDLRMLATSRTPLHIEGEATFSVQALETPDPDHLPALESLTTVPAVSLFVERARAVRDSFELTATSGAAVADICHRLGGLPLAIELAAARVAVFSPREIVSRLASTEFLDRRGVSGPRRHESLRTALDWSYDLLSAQEQELFRRLGSFPPGWSLESAEEICKRITGGKPDLLEPLTRLVDQSLIISEEDGGLTRYRSLGPVRAYALERLNEAQEKETTLRAHASYYRKVAERINTNSWTFPRDEGLEALGRERQNFLAALGWSVGDGDAVTALRLCLALWGFWRIRGHLGTAAEQLEAALAIDADVPTVLRMVTLLEAANFAQLMRNGDRATKHASEGLALARQTASVEGEAIALATLGDIAVDSGDFREARQLYGQALAIAERSGTPAAVAWALASLGTLAQREGNDEAAEEMLEKAVSLLDSPRAHDWHRGVVLARLAPFVRRRGDPIRAGSLLREAIARLRAVHARVELTTCLEELARVAIDERQPARAATLFGAAGALREATGAVLSDDGLQMLAGDVDKVRKGLGERAFNAAWTAGHALSLDNAVEAALSKGDIAAMIADDSPLAALTPRENEVAMFLAEGLTNLQIAERLVVSEGTARTHVERIMRKLGYRSRVQVATLVTEQRRQMELP